MKHIVVIGLAILAACGGRRDAGQPEPPPPPLDLTGFTVMLLPVQSRAAHGLDPELAFWLREAAPRTEWLLPDGLQRLVDRSPVWRVSLDALPPGLTQVGRERRVQGQLYDHLRRLGALTDARFALVPFARPALDDDGVLIELAAALVDVVGGRVLWFGTVRGEPAAPGEGPHPASAAAALARALVP